MKTMKKLLALVMALALCLSLGVCAMAAEVTATTAQTVSATITKMYTETNEGTTSPADTFKFKVENYSVSDADSTVTVETMPTPTISDITVAEGDATVEGKSYTLSINLPSYTSVGIYTYTVTETDNKLAGVTYDSTTYYLSVYVTQNDGVLSVSSWYLHASTITGEKADNIDNTYSAGSLQISKTVTGSMGDKTKYFKVTVTLTEVDGYTYADSFAVSGGSYESNPTSIKIGEATTFYLKDGETITIANVPYDVTYTVVEDNYTGDNGGYDAAAYSGSDGTTGAGTVDSATETVTITNNKNGEVDTGITLDSLPYVLVLVAVLALGAVMIIRKRRVED